MSTAAQHLGAHPHVETIKRYYAACTAADVEGVVACCTPDVVHYFLAPGTESVRGAEPAVVVVELEPGPWMGVVHRVLRECTGTAIECVVMAVPPDTIPLTKWEVATPCARECAG